MQPCNQFSLKGEVEESLPFFTHRYFKQLMKYFVVIRTAPKNLELHTYIRETLEALLDLGSEIVAVFFTEQGASIASKNFAKNSVEARIQQSYMTLRQRGIDLLCCGGAFRGLGMSNEDVVDGISLAGNLELSQLFAQYQALEF